MLSGTDWRGRTRQHALDRSFMKAGQVPRFIFDMLSRLEGSDRRDATCDTVTAPSPRPPAPIPVPA